MSDTLCLREKCKAFFMKTALCIFYINLRWLRFFMVFDFSEREILFFFDLKNLPDIFREGLCFSSLKWKVRDVLF